MRKLKLAPFMLIPAIFGLSSCTLPSWLSFLSFIPGLEAPEKEEKEPEKEEKEEEKKYTCLEVVKDICRSLFELPEGEEPVCEDDDPENYHYWSYGDGSYGTGVSFGASYANEQYLPVAVSTVAAELPSYCVAEGEAFADTWDDGSNGYFQLFDVAGGVVVQLGSYVSTVLGCQVDVYPAE